MRNINEELAIFERPEEARLAFAALAAEVADLLRIVMETGAVAPSSSAARGIIDHAPSGVARAAATSGSRRQDP